MGWLNGRGWQIPAIVALLALLAMWLAEPQSPLLRYQREALLAGEWWRLWTAHWIHLGWAHLWLNLAGLLLCWLLVGRAFSAAAWLALISADALFISLGLLWWLPELSWYVGLSGLLHGMLLGGSLVLWRQGSIESGLLLLLVLGKLGWEAWQGPSAGTEASIGGTVVTEAHLLGALGGLLYVMLAQGLRALRQRRH